MTDENDERLQRLGVLEYTSGRRVRTFEPVIEERPEQSYRIPKELAEDLLGVYGINVYEDFYDN